MEKIRLAKITHYEKNKDGEPLLTKNNKPYIRCVIQDNKGRTLSGFGSNQTKKWAEGGEIEVEVTQNGQYLNFRLPPQNVSREEFDLLAKKVKFLEDEIGYLHNQIDGKDQKEQGEPEEIDLGEPPDEAI